MRACVDNVTLDSRPGHGTVVTMRKHIRWTTDAPLRQYPVASLGKIDCLGADRGHYFSRVTG